MFYYFEGLLPLATSLLAQQWSRYHQVPLYFVLNYISLVRQLHREFLRAGSDVIQAFTFTLDDDLGGEHAKHGVGIILSFNFF